MRKGMKLIPAQTFMMGDNTGLGRTASVPVHPVTLDAFYMSQNLVTVQEYCDFLNDIETVIYKSYVAPKGHENNSKDFLIELWTSPVTQKNGKFVPRPGMAKKPMYYAFWKGAVLYCNWLSGKEGLHPCYRLEEDWVADLNAGGYHLPTEAQWECAARGGLSGKLYPWGDKIDSKKANYDNYVGGMTDVGSYPPNAYGICDLAGNVMEWCDDWFTFDYYSTIDSGVRNPRGMMRMMYPHYHSVRGGAYYQPAEYQQCSYRYGPSDTRAGYNFQGFRVVREALSEACDPAREAKSAQDWYARFASGRAQDVPISFRLGGRPSSELLKTWKVSKGEESRENGKNIRTILLTDADGKIEIACELTAFDGFPAVDWLFRVTNRGTKDTPIIEDLRVLDGVFCKDSKDKREFILRRSRGSRMYPTDFAPTDEILPAGSKRTLAGHGARSSDYDFPFMNLSTGRGGMVIGVGWSGQWQLRFERDKASEVRIVSGMEKTHLKLYPGESIRTPRMMILFWDGTDMMRGHNLFRKLNLAHYNPRIDGKLVIPPIAKGVCGLNEYTEQNQLEAVPKLKKAGLEVLWIDAGWFVGGWSHGMGTWTPRPEMFPNGLGPVGDACHKAGLKLLVWFEPERSSRDSLIDREYQKWVIGPVTEYGGLFNWGIPEARKWMTDVLSEQITLGKIDIFRNDFNIEALYYLQRTDKRDRQGIAEIRFVEGMYRMWDDLRERHPGLWIDNCASGGRMIDLETSMRSIPLWQSDAQDCGGGDVVAQLQNAGLNLYIPMHCCGCPGLEPDYSFRSAMMAGNPMSGDWFGDAEGAKRSLDIIKLARPYFEGDYYPLFPHKIDENRWFGYQLDLPEEGKGMVVVFRRCDCLMSKMPLFLQGIDQDAQYEVTDRDSGTVTKVKGAVLRSYYVDIPEQPGSRILFYKKL